MKNFENGEYWIYVLQTDKTSTNHKTILIKLAEQYKISITRIFEETEKANTFHNLEIKNMIDLIPVEKPSGILTFDVNNFLHGDIQEQGFILDTIRKNNVKIITPRKIYDFNDENSEEYSEFEAIILAGRLQRGKIQRIQEGNYIGTRPPFGYDITYDGKGGRFLVPNPEQAEVVKMIFNWYTHPDPNKRMGSSNIAKKLNEINIKSYTGRTWEPSTVLNILKNAVYIGRIQWGKKKIKKSSQQGKRRQIQTIPQEYWIDVEGKHEPIIDKETFERAQDILSGSYHDPYHIDESGQVKISNPLAGLIKCDMCGATMIYRPYKRQAAHLRCNTQGCKNKSTRYDYVEKRVIQALEEWLHDLKIEVQNENDIVITKEIESKKNLKSSLERELKELEQQKEKLFDLLERGIYNEEIFLERSKKIQRRISEAETSIQQLNDEIKKITEKEATKKQIIPHVQKVIDTIHLTDDPAKKNALLKSLLHYATYRKEKHQVGDQFTLVLHPKL